MAQLMSGVQFQAFLSKVEETFQCICCQELVFQPVTTVCQHNVCKVSAWLPPGAGAPGQGAGRGPSGAGCRLLWAPCPAPCPTGVH